MHGHPRISADARCCELGYPAGMTTQSVPPAMPLPDAGASNTVAKRNVRILTVAQALGGATPPIIVSLGGVIGMQLADDKALATLPVSLLNIGLACAVIPAAWLMRRYGRRIGYIIGCLAGVISGIVAAAGTARGAFWLFCLGTFLSGFYIAFVQSYRFAAIDSASESYKARAISLVMVGGLFAAVIGPQTVIWTRELTPLYPFAASFLALSGLALMAMLVARAEEAGLRRQAAWRDHAPATLHNRRYLRTDELRADDISDDGSTNGHGRLRPQHRRGRAGHPMACAGDVRAELLYR